MSATTSAPGAGLRLLDEVSWHGRAIPGDRAAALLAALALEPSGCRDATLVEAVWPDAAPAEPTKALHVVVSRARAASDAGLIRRYDGGYRLGLGQGEVDAWRVDVALAAARDRLADAPEEAVELARSVVETVVEEGGNGALGELREHAARQQSLASRVLGIALSRLGRHDEARKLLEAAHEVEPDDVPTLEALLRSIAETGGTAAALARFEDYRAGLAERLGVDPDPALQRLHVELLGADRPVRSGIRFDTDELLGRNADLARLRELVAAGRLTSIVGPGGLGKTRLAHVLARESTLPRVFVVELVAITSPDDVVAEVATVVGLRDSVADRRALTPAQRADIRGRLGQELDTGPCLLVLDNCEHLLEPVASLVSYLLAVARDLRILTTSRAPLRIAAERVLPLSHLDVADGVALFRRRALAVRPSAELDDEVVTEVVQALDGLPLAIELAAARVRAMSLAEVRDRLGDRLGLLRSRDRALPERHQTLTAVIAWSWELLEPDEREALAMLSVFPDGCGISVAEAVLGARALDVIEPLVEHSLLRVEESDQGARYRMLETVREFAGSQLAESDLATVAHEAAREWALNLADRLRAAIFGVEQFVAIDELALEENNLADQLRAAVTEGDPAAAVRLFSTLGGYWAMTGDHGRVFTMITAFEQLLADWEPPPALVGATQDCLAIVLIHAGIFGERDVEPIVLRMQSYGVPERLWTRVAYLAFSAGSVEEGVARCAALADGEDTELGLMGLLFACNMAENSGDTDEAFGYAERALELIRPDSMPWLVAAVHTNLAMACLQYGDPARATRHAEQAWPVLHRLRAHDDGAQVHVVIALAHLFDGRVREARAVIDEVMAIGGATGMGGQLMLLVDVEVLLAEGRVAEGLARCREGSRQVQELRFPGMEPDVIGPWLLVMLSAALLAHVRHAETPEDRAHIPVLAGKVAETCERVRRQGRVDLPLTGMGLAALAGWILEARTPYAPEVGVRLLHVAERCRYNRSLTMMSWDRLAAAAEQAAPGQLARCFEEHAASSARSLLAGLDDLAVISGSLGGAVTSSG